MSQQALDEAALLDQIRPGSELIAATTLPLEGASVGEECAALVLALRSADVAAQAAAGRRVGELAAGERDVPKSEEAVGNIRAVIYDA